MDEGGTVYLAENMHLKVGVKRIMSVAMAAVIAGLCSPGGSACATRLSLNGTSGILMTPTADIAADGALAAGASFVDKKWAVDYRDKYDNVAYFVTLGYLPRLEMSMRVTVFPGSSFSLEDPDRSEKDRMFSLKVLALKERGHWPALALGSEDLTGTKRFNTLFAVASKGLSLGRAGPLRLHLGYGSDQMDAKNHPLVGVFGGLAKALWKGGELLAEYDTDKVNVGLRVEPVPYVSLLVSALNFESFAGVVNVNFQL
jgi:hypothetical protein